MAARSRFGLAALLVFSLVFSTAVSAQQNVSTVTIGVESVRITEGATAVFIVTRDGLASATTVRVSVSARPAEVGVPIDASIVPFTTFIINPNFVVPGALVFKVGQQEARYEMLTDSADDDWQAHTSLTVTVKPGPGYVTLPGRDSATVRVEDDDLPDGIRVGLVDPDASGDEVPLFFDEGAGSVCIPLFGVTEDYRGPHGSGRMVVSLQAYPTLGDALPDVDFEDTFSSVPFLHPSDFSFVSENNRWEARTCFDFIIRDDEEIEGTEGITINVEAAESLMLPNVTCSDSGISCGPRARVLIRDNDVPEMTVGFANTERRVAEGAGTLTVAVVARTLRAEKPHDDVRIGVVGLSTSNLTTVSPGDYFLDVAEILIDPADFERDGLAYRTTLSFSVLIEDDGTFEQPEAFTLELERGSDLNAAVTLEPGGALAVIAIEDDDVPAMTVGFAETGLRVVEGAGALTVEVVARTLRAERPHDDVRIGMVSLSTSSSTAVSPGDYFLDVAEILIDPADFERDGQAYRATLSFSVRIEDDGTFEQAEAFTLELERGSDLNAAVTLERGRESAVVTIEDDDVPAMTVGFADTEPRVEEDAGTLTVEVVARTEGDERPHDDVRIGAVRLSNGSITAVSPGDYSLVVPEMSISPSSFKRDGQAGVYRATLSFSVRIEDDRVFEQDEIFILVLRRGSDLDAAVTFDSSRGATITIEDDDAPVVSIAVDGADEIMEGDTATFMLTRVGNDLNVVSRVAVSVSTRVEGVEDVVPRDLVDDVIALGIDVSPLDAPVALVDPWPRSVTFRAGVTERRVMVRTVGDDEWQSHTWVTVTVGSGATYEVSSLSGNATVRVEDDDLPEIQGGFIAFSVMRSEEDTDTSDAVTTFGLDTSDIRPPHRSFTVTLKTRDGTAKDGEDYQGYLLGLEHEPRHFGFRLLSDPPRAFFRGPRINSAGLAEIDDHFAEPPETYYIDAIVPDYVERKWTSGSSELEVVIFDRDFAPVITSTGPFPAPERSTHVFTQLEATDGNFDILAWSIEGGPDGDRFTLGERGELSFNAPQYFENPDDFDKNGVYELDVRVTDGYNPVTKTVTVELLPREILIAARTPEITEGMFAMFTVTRRGGVAESLTLDVSVEVPDGVLVDPPPTTVLFPAGHFLVNLDLETTPDDEVWERDATITVTVDTGDYTTPPYRVSAAVLVRDDDVPAMTVGFADVELRVVENAGALAVEVVARTLRDERPHADVEIGEIRLSTSDATAVSPDDYVIDVLEMSISPADFERDGQAGAYSATLSFPVRIRDDGRFEQDESFTLELERGSDLDAAVTLEPGRSSAVVTIEDDDVSVMTVGFADVGPRVVESAGALTVEVVVQTPRDERPGDDAEIGHLRLSSNDGTAVSPDDYTIDVSEVLISPSSFERDGRLDIYRATLSFSVRVENDGIFERDESFTLELERGSDLNAEVAFDPDRASAVVTIEDDDVPEMTVGFADVGLRVVESAVALAVEVVARTLRDERPHDDVEIGYIRLTSNDGTATSEDYIAGGEERVIHPSSFMRVGRVGPYVATLTFSVRIEHDDLVERDEDFELVLNRTDILDQAATIDPAGASLTITIVDDDDFQVSVKSLTREVSEGRSVEFMLTREVDVTRELTVLVSVSTRTGGTGVPDGVPGVTFVGGFPRQAIFNAGSGTALVTVRSEDNNDWQAHTAVMLEVVEDAGNYLVLPGAGSATVLVRDDDVPEMAVGFESTRVRITEADVALVVKVLVRTLRNERPHDDVDIGQLRVIANDGTATTPGDYVDVDRLLEIHPQDFFSSGDEYEADLDFPVQIRDDGELEQDENFELSLDRTDDLDSSVTIDPAGAAAVVTIENDDFSVVSIEPLVEKVNEGMPATFVLMRDDNGLDVALTVSVSVSTRTAEPYAPDNAPNVTVVGEVSRQATFNEGGRMARVVVQTRDDETWQAHTSLTVTVEPGTGYEVSTVSGSATVRVEDDDLPEGIAVGIVDPIAGDSAPPFLSVQTDTLYFFQEDVGDARIDFFARSSRRPHGDREIEVSFRNDFPLGTVQPGADYERERNLSVVFRPSDFVMRENGAAWEALASASFGIVDDMSEESLEYFLVTLFRTSSLDLLPVGIDLRQGVAVVFILDNDHPVISVRADVDEVGEGSTAVFTLRREGDRSEDLLVLVALSAQPMEMGVPSDAPTVNLVSQFPNPVPFGGGAEELRLEVLSVDDRRWQAHTELILAVLDGSDYRVSPSSPSATVLVRDDDVPAMTVGFSSTRVVVAEGAGTLEIEVVARTTGDDERLRPGVVIGAIGLVSHGTAMAPDDYEDRTGEITLIPSGFTRVGEEGYETTLRFIVEIVDDEEPEPEEEFVLVLIGVGLAPAVTIDPAVAVVVITDDDSVVSIEKAADEVTESSPAVFTLRREGGDLDEPLAVSVSVLARVAEASAPDDAPGVRFAPFPAEAIFAAGDETTQVVVRTEDDEVWQAHTTVRVTVLPGAGYAVSPGASSAVVLVRDDDLPEGIVIGIVDPNPGDSNPGNLFGEDTDNIHYFSEKAGNVEVGLFARVDRQPHGDRVMEVLLKAFDVSTLFGTDYEILSPSISVRFRPSTFVRVIRGGEMVWEAPAFVPVRIIDDTEAEGDEGFVMTLLSPSSLGLLPVSVSVSTEVALAVIVDDDRPVVPVVSVSADVSEVIEGSAAVFTLRRLGGEVGEPLTVGVSVSTQVAEVGVPPGSPGVAFGGFPDEVSFDSGETTARLLISSEADEAWQAHTSLTAVVEFGADYVVSPGASSAAVLVRDDDVPAMVVGFSGTGMMVEEGVGTLSVGVVARTAGDERPHADVGIGDIRLSAVAGTAMAAPPSDYVLDPVSVSLSPSSFTRVDAGGYELALSFVVEIVDDEIAELEEEFVLTLTGEGLAPSVSIDPGSLAVVIADDDDPAVPIDAASTEVIEGSTIVFTLTRLDADLDEEIDGGRVGVNAVGGGRRTRRGLRGVSRSSEFCSRRDDGAPGDYDRGG